MKRSSRLVVWALTAWLVSAGAALAAEKFTRQQDIIYGRKFGTALTMDVFTPPKPNGAAVIVCISGGWVSNHDQINPAFAFTLLNRGYTVFAVVHGSQPKFTIPECVEDINRAVRYIRTHADDFKIDGDKIGITGASAGGHLSLMLGCAGCEGDPERQGSGRSGQQLRAGRGVFLSADRLFELRPAGHQVAGHRAEPQIQSPVRFSRAGPRDEDVRAGRPGDARKDRARRCRRSITSMPAMLPR